MAHTSLEKESESVGSLSDSDWLGFKCLTTMYTSLTLMSIICYADVLTAELCHHARYRSTRLL